MLGACLRQRRRKGSRAQHMGLAAADGEWRNRRQVGGWVGGGEGGTPPVDDSAEDEADDAVGDPAVDAPVEEGEVHGPLCALVGVQLGVPVAEALRARARLGVGVARLVVEHRLGDAEKEEADPDPSREHLHAWWFVCVGRGDQRVGGECSQGGWVW